MEFRVARFIMALIWHPAPPLRLLQVACGRRRVARSGQRTADCHQQDREEGPGRVLLQDRRGQAARGEVLRAHRQRYSTVPPYALLEKFTIKVQS